MGESTGLDTSALMTALNSVGESIKDFIGEMLPYLLGIATAALVLYFGIWAFRMIKKWFSKGS